jgi:hypothetical protein
MHLSWNPPAPTPDVQHELDKFASYTLSHSIIGKTRLVEPRCSVCNHKHGPVWLTAKALRTVCNHGRCWSCR